ncbi:hypothetical protein [Aquimarina macrocephali]|uniref:hypothetical protein n=1 Tax=Aquimarina macrocephali TaxID=666563 RepID=UPI0004B7EB75|nr:hypothetical protein [Aquimarina macrocephali]
MRNIITKKIYLLCFVSSILSCQTQVSEIKQFKTDAFSILYPSNLKLDKSKVDRTEFMLFTEKTSETDNFIENINLVIHDYNISLKEHIKYSNIEVAKIATITKSETIDNNNLKIHRIVYTLTENNVDLTVLQHSLIVNNKVFVLTFCGKSVEFNKYQSEMENIMLSFKLLKHDNYIRPRRL